MEIIANKKKLLLNAIISLGILIPHTAQCWYVPYPIKNAIYSFCRYDHGTVATELLVSSIVLGIATIRNTQKGTLRYLTGCGILTVTSLSTCAWLYYNQKLSNEALQNAISDNSDYSVSQALSQGANPNHSITGPLSSTITPLMYAMMENGQAPFPFYQKTTSITDTDILKTLIENGANTNRPSYDSNACSYYPLMVAKNASQTKILLDANANIHAESSQGKTALHYAKNIEVTKQLLDAGIHPEAFSLPADKTPLQEAIAENEVISFEKIKMLLAYGASARKWRQHFNPKLFTKNTFNIFKLLLFVHPDNDLENDTLKTRLANDLCAKNQEEKSIKNIMLTLLEDQEKLALHVSDAEKQEFSTILKSNTQSAKIFKSHSQLLGEKIYYESFAHYPKTSQTNEFKDLSTLIAEYRGDNH